MKKIGVLLNLVISFFLVSCSGGNSSSTSTSESSSISSEGSLTSSSSEGPSSAESESSKTSSEEESSSSSDSYVSVTSVELDESSLKIYTDDYSAILTATVFPENATNKALTWESSNIEVATVEDGAIKPIKAGETTIKVKTVDGGYSDQCIVTVKDPVTIDNYVLHGLFYGETQWTDKPMVNNPASTTEYMIQGVSLHANDVFKIHMFGDTWYGYSAIKSSVKAGLVATAPNDDNIKVLESGVYDIYSDYNEFEGGHIYISKVEGTTPDVVPVSGISLSNSGKYLLTRTEFIITPTVYPNNATNKDVTWRSSDTSIATVTSAGRVVASVNSKVGKTIITAKTVDGGFTATCIVYVSASQYPAYCLTGTVGGYSRSGISMRYAAIPLETTGKYLIPDVDLVAGDKLTVTDNRGTRLKDWHNKVYEKEVNQNMSVNVYLDVNNADKDYLSFAPKNGN